MSGCARHDWAASRVGRRWRHATDRPTTIRSFPLRRRLRFEPLEDRRVLSTITVDTLIDVNANDGLTTLREAIAAAAPGDTIDFSVTGTINLSSLGQLTINKNLTISGPGSNLLTINAFDPTPVTKNGDGSRVFNIDDGNSGNLLDVSISGLTLTGGDRGGVADAGGGGAIFSSENLAVTASTISGNSAESYGGGIYNVGGDVTVTDTTISDNSTTISWGGGISSYRGNVTVTRSTISGNSASGNGGGIYNLNGELTVIGSTIIGNSATGRGGGISSQGGNVTVTASTISGNSVDDSGGGIDSRAGSLTDTLTVTDSTISDNSSGGSGGGLYHRGGGGTVVTSSTISGNSATSGNGGGIHSRYGTVTVMNSTISDNSAMGGQDFGGGGGISGVTVTVMNSTISGNSAHERGGGILGSTVTVTNSTINDNSAGGRGGGIYGNASVTESTISGNSAGGSGGGIFGTASVTESTISGNSATSGGGIYNLNGPTFVRFSTVTDNEAPDGQGSGVASIGNAARTEVQSSIVAGNVNSDVDFVGGVTNSFQSNGYNLIGTGNATGEFVEPGDQTGVVDPLLGPLADNGGPTMTHALLAGSPAINAGDPTAVPGVGGVPLHDQRGAPFSRAAGGRIDIGALERQPIPPVVFGDYNQNGVVDAADYVLWRKTLGSNVAPSSGADGDGDGIVNQDDYGVWRAHFGMTVPAAGAANGVDAEDPHPLATDAARQYPSRPLPEGEVVVEDPDPLATPAARRYPSRPLLATASLRPEGEVVVGLAPVDRSRRVGSRQDAAAMLRYVAARRDDSLVAWLASRTDGLGRGSDDDGTGTAGYGARAENDGRESVGGDALAAVFASLDDE